MGNSKAYDPTTKKPPPPPPRPPPPNKEALAFVRGKFGNKSNDLAQLPDDHILFYKPHRSERVLVTRNMWNVVQYESLTVGTVIPEAPPPPYKESSARPQSSSSQGKLP
ncbi:hypothetical protein C8R46DRAFT_1027524 [Mycena filopes]|nr:hypothetical protein C8R46DRAFT_1027524 [Mycena filopes]